MIHSNGIGFVLASLVTLLIFIGFFLNVKKSFFKKEKGTS